MGRLSVHLGQWGARGEEKGVRNGADGFYAQRLSIPRREKKGGGGPGRVAHWTHNRLVHATEGAQLVRLQRRLVTAAGNRKGVHDACACVSRGLQYRRQRSCMGHSGWSRDGLGRKEMGRAQENSTFFKLFEYFQND
jgi:hypothetical protein